MQDGDDAVFVSNVDANDLKFGDRVRVVGVSIQGDVSTFIGAERVYTLKSELPLLKPNAIIWAT